MLRHCRRVAVVAVLAAVLSGLTTATAPAWELDVHYLLTHWLAAQGGFSRRDADEIARGSQSYDDSDHHSAIPTMLWILLRGDLGAARDLQLKHFPSDATLPSPPQRRLVAPGGALARDAIEAAIRPGQTEPSLLRVGEALHPFHDSWSHQGVPDVPLGLRPQLSCAHPAARGGWSSHDADLTHLHVEEVIELAGETHKLLQQFLSRYPRFRARQSEAWSKLEPLVRQFATASTKRDKDQWAVKYLTGSPATFSAGLTVSGPRDKLLGRAVRPPVTLTKSRGAPPEVVGRAQAFSKAWIREQNVEAAIEFVDWQALRAQFADRPGALGARVDEARAAVIQWCRRFMTMYLVDDHAAVNRAGHCNPEHPGYRELPESPTSEGAFRVSRGLSPPPLVPEDFVELEGGENPEFALALQLEGLPWDAVCFIWTLKSRNWKITRMFAVVG